MATGRIMRFDPDRGYGFITPDDAGPDLFLHISEMPRGIDPRKIRRETAVFFESEDTVKGPKAVRVRLSDAHRDAGEPASPTEQEWRALWDGMFEELLAQVRRRGWVQD